jgi:hypothetical protein
MSLLLFKLIVIIVKQRVVSPRLSARWGRSVVLEAWVFREKLGRCFVLDIMGSCIRGGHGVVADKGGEQLRAGMEMRSWS